MQHNLLCRWGTSTCGAAADQVAATLHTPAWSEPYLSSIQVGRGHLRRCCDQCGGELACMQSPEAHAAGLAVFRGIARFHGFELLAETVEWLLNVPGAA